MRVFLTFVYYGVFIYAVSNLFLWVQMKPDFTSLTSPERFGMITVVVVLTLLFVAISELYALRTDFLDAVLGKEKS